MSGFRSLSARPIFGLTLAVHFLLFANVIPWTHTCRIWVHPNGSCERPALCAFYREGNNAVASREALDSSNALAQEDLCLACLCTAQLRSLSPPSGVDTLALAQAQETLGEPSAIPDLSRIWFRLLPRAPPTSISS